jgi:hypothetical protein
MPHFSAALHLSDVVTKLHALVFIAMLERHAPRPSTLSFELARADSTGSWVGALRDAATRLRPASVEDGPAEAWLDEARGWLTRKRGRPDGESLRDVLEPIADLVRELGAGRFQSSVRPSGNPLDLMQLMVTVRNKTTGHHAYGPDFWAAHAERVAAAAQWLTIESPLWVADLALPLEREGAVVARILRGAEPTRTIPIGELADGAAVLCLLGETPLADLGDLIWVDSATNLTFLANGAWRDSDSSSEFLCHSLEATSPGEGCRRKPLPDFAIRPAAMPASDTEGVERLVLTPDLVPNNLPAGSSDYVRRGQLEQTLHALLSDARRRHLINVRGPGGFGKTSLVLQLCHELAAHSDTCPYDAIVWMSARDVDLTLRGAVPVQRAEESLADVWRRFAGLFGETDESVAREYFEAAMRTEPLLVVLDNFETFEGQEQAYEYLDELVQPPAKVVITSRHTFKGDYSVEVKGMADAEAEKLLIQSARAAGVEPLMTPQTRAKIFARCQGHPYAMKLVASQVKTEAGLTDLLNQVLRKEDLLEALFRRSVDDLVDHEDAIFVFLLVSQFRGGLSEAAARVVTEPASIDLDDALHELLRRSLIEVADGPAVLYDMPAMAREFADKHLAGHLLQTEISSASTFLRRWVPLIEGRVAEAAEAISRAVRSGELATPDMQRASRALRVLTTFDPRLWGLVAVADRESGAPEDVWEAAYKRAIEADPARPDLLFEWSEATKDFDRQVELKVQAASVDRGNVALASRVANFLNGLYARDRDRYSSIRWAALMGRIIEALEANFLELDGEALSRLAWLYIHAGRANEVERVVERGLTVDFGNEDLRKLARRNNMKL